MFQRTIVTTLGLAVLLMAIALTLPNWQSSQYDSHGHVRAFSGLWQQVLQFSSTSRGDCARMYPTEGECEGGKDPITGEKKKSDTRCFWDKASGRCSNENAHCATMRSATECKGRCTWSDESDTCYHEKDFDVDIVRPYDDVNDHRQLVVSRVLGILAAALGFVAFVVAAMPVRRPALVAMLSGVAALAAVALVIFYATQLEQGPSNKDALQQRFAPLAGWIAKHFMDRNKAYVSNTSYGGSWVMALIAAILLTLSTVLGGVDRSLLVK